MTLLVVMIVSLCQAARFRRLEGEDLSQLRAVVCIHVNPTFVCTSQTRELMSPNRTSRIPSHHIANCGCTLLASLSLHSLHQPTRKSQDLLRQTMEGAATP